MADSGASMSVVVIGSGSKHLVSGLAGLPGRLVVPANIGRFRDGELDVSLPVAVRGHRVTLLASTGPPVNESLLELLFLADACRRGGATRVDLMVPYLGYARQDRSPVREQPSPLPLRLVGDLLGATGAGELTVVDPHSAAVETAVAFPVRRLSAVRLLAAAVAARVVERPIVVVAPDLGAAKLAAAFGSVLGAPYACVVKVRLSGESVRADEVIGDVAGRFPVVVDDMISTGGTVVAAVEAVRLRGAAPGGVAAATHGVFAGDCLARLHMAGIDEVVVTDTLPPPRSAPAGVTVVSISDLLTSALQEVTAAI